MGALEAAVAWLRRELAGGPRPTEDLEESATAAGVSRSSLKRAKPLAGVQSRRIGFGAGARYLSGIPPVVGDVEAYWSAMPDQAQPPETTAVPSPPPAMADHAGPAPNPTPARPLPRVKGPPRMESRWERLARERHERDLALCAQPGGHPRGFCFDEAEGLRVVEFIEKYCLHHEGEWGGMPLLQQEWQKANIVRTFGWMRADGTRRFRTTYWEIPRKNGKSTEAGAVGLYLFVGDGEPGAQVYSSATKQEQAAIVWTSAANTVKASPDLRRFIRIRRNNLWCERTGSKFLPLGADSETQDGLNVHGNLVDELHAHKNRKLWDVLDTAMGARRQPLTVAITTAGHVDPESIGYKMHLYAQQVLEGVIEDDAFYAFIASADEGEETERKLREQPDYYFTDEAHQKANPGYGVSVKPEFLVQQALKARNEPDFLPEYLRLHLNVWVQTTRRWLSLERWSASDPTPAGADLRQLATARERELEGFECFGALDFAIRLDLVAFVLAFPRPDNAVEFVCRFWLPEETIRRYVNKGERHYETWVRQGWLTPTSGDVVDDGFIRNEILQLSKRFRMREFAYDHWNAHTIALALGNEGLKPIEFGQSYRFMSEPAKDLETRVASLKVRHAGNPILKWCAANAVVTTDPAGNIKPDKAKASGKIDGVVAAVMALARLNANAAQPAPADPYKTRGFLQL